MPQRASLRARARGHLLAGRICERLRYESPHVQHAGGPAGAAAVRCRSCTEHAANGWPHEDADTERSHDPTKPGSPARGAGQVCASVVWGLGFRVRERGRGAHTAVLSCAPLPTAQSAIDQLIAHLCTGASKSATQARETLMMLMAATDNGTTQCRVRLLQHQNTAFGPTHYIASVNPGHSQL